MTTLVPECAVIWAPSSLTSQLISFLTNLGFLCLYTQNKQKKKPGLIVWFSWAWTSTFAANLWLERQTAVSLPVSWVCYKEQRELCNTHTSPCCHQCNCKKINYLDQARSCIPTFQYVPASNMMCQHALASSNWPKDISCNVTVLLTTCWPLKN